MPNPLFPTRLHRQTEARNRVKIASVSPQQGDRIHAMSKPSHRCHISTRAVFWAEIVIESTGGTDPITSHSHRKKDAQRIRDLIEQYQAQARVQ